MNNDITLYDFISLSETEKASAVWENGMFIGYYKDVSFKRFLFQLFDFYVEIIYEEDQNKIVQFRAL